MNKLYPLLSVIILLISTGCENDTEMTDVSETTNSSESMYTEVEETIDGTYSLTEGPITIEFTINGNSWYGTSTSSSDYKRGTVKGNDLYEGNSKVGTVKDNILTINSYGINTRLTKE